MKKYSNSPYVLLFKKPANNNSVGTIQPKCRLARYCRSGANNNSMGNM